MKRSYRNIFKQIMSGISWNTSRNAARSTTQEIAQKIDQRRSACLLSTEGIRRIRALGIVIIILVLPIFIERIFDVTPLGATTSSVAESKQSTPVSFQAADMHNSPSAVLKQIEETSLIGIVADRDVFSDEIVIPDHAENFRFDSSSSVFSFEVEGQAQEVLNQLSQLWTSLGWVEVPLGGLSGATFIKGEGEYRWMFVTCTQMGTQVCVVGTPQRS